MHVLGTLFFKRDNSMLMCGIFAFSGKKGITPEQLHMATIKMKILGIYNESRGGQGAGVYINSQIIKCADKHKKFPELIENNLIEIPQDNSIMFGHCRRMSRGVVSYENTHPFEINDNLIGVHNGTINNIWSLTSERKINTQTIHNDSLALFMIIEQEGAEKVLNEYKGGAALIWTTRNETNTLYVYHGASKTKKDGDPEEERPLFYLKTPEGIYFSSMEDSLFAIRDNDNEIPVVLDHNRVIKVSNGKFSRDRIVISREEMNIPYTYTPPANNKKVSGYDDDDAYDPKAWYGIGQGNASARRDESTNFSQVDILGTKGLKHDPVFLREIRPAESETINSVFFHKGRYYRTILVKQFELCEGELWINRDRVIRDDETIGASAYYFHKGVMLDSQQAYLDLMGEIENRTIILDGAAVNFAFAISKYSKFPVVNLPMDYKPGWEERLKYTFYFRQEVSNVGFTPKFGTRHYNIKKGLIVEITSVGRKEKEVIYKSFTESNTALALAEGTKNFHQRSTIVKELPAPITNIPIVINNPNQSIVKRIGFFDAIFESWEELDMLLDKSFDTAFEKFAEDYLKLSKERELDVDVFEINDFVNKCIRKVVNEKISLREAFTGSKDSLDLERYYAKVTDAEDERKRSLLAYDIKEEEVVDELPFRTQYNQASANNIKTIDEMLEMIEKEKAELDAEEPVEEKGLDEEETFEENLHKLDRTNDQLEDVADYLKELRRAADELQVIDSDLAQNSSSILYKNIDDVVHKLSEQAEKHSTKEIVNKINQVTTN